MARSTRFTFVGEIVLPKEGSARPLVNKMKGGKDGNLDMVSLNFGVKAGNSVGYVEMFGMKTEKIFTMSTNNEKLEIAWEDRTDQAISKDIASYKKHFIQLEGDTVSEFVTEYDTILYLEDAIRKAQEKVKVIGTVEKEPYVNKKGTRVINDRYIIQNIYLAREDEKPRLQIDMDFYYTNDSVDRTDVKIDKTITVDGFVRQYVRNTKTVNEAIGEAGKEMFIPQRAILSGSKLDFDNENDLKKWKIREKYLSTGSGKKLYHCLWRCQLVAGAEEIEFDESQLTSAQMELIDAGLASVEDFRPRDIILGPKKKELRLNTPLLTGDFQDGIIEADFTLSELEEETMKFIEPEHLEDILAKSEEKTAEKEESGYAALDDFDDDFGI